MRLHLGGLIMYLKFIMDSGKEYILELEYDIELDDDILKDALTDKLHDVTGRVLNSMVMMSGVKYKLQDEIKHDILIVPSHISSIEVIDDEQVIDTLDENGDGKAVENSDYVI